MDSTASGVGSLLLLAVMIAVSGLIVGALARWFMPGPDPMSWMRTILLGLGGSFIGGIATALLRIDPEKQSWLALILSVAGALFLLWFGRRRRSTVT